MFSLAFPHNSLHVKISLVLRTTHVSPFSCTSNSLSLILFYAFPFYFTHFMLRISSPLYFDSFFSFLPFIAQANPCILTLPTHARILNTCLSLTFYSSFFSFSFSSFSFFQINSSIFTPCHTSFHLFVCVLVSFTSQCFDYFGSNLHPLFFARVHISLSFMLLACVSSFSFVSLSVCRVYSIVGLSLIIFKYLSLSLVQLPW